MGIVQLLEPAVVTAATAVVGAVAAAAINEARKYLQHKGVLTEVEAGLKALGSAATAAGLSPAAAETAAAKGLSGWLRAHGLNVSASAVDVFARNAALQAKIDLAHAAAAPAAPEASASTAHPTIG